MHSDAADARPARAEASPLVVQVLDIVGVVSLLVALTVVANGGFREWTPFGRLSVTTWSRPLALGVVLLVLRHWRYPRPHLLARVAAAWRRLRGLESFRVALPVVIGTRTGVFLAGFLALALFGYRADVAVPWRIHDDELLNLPARWDTGWYLGIANYGYEWSRLLADRQQNIAFFPLYPLLIRYGSLLLGREVLWTSVLISWVALVWALAYLYRFVQPRHGSEAAGAAVALMACYPFALFFGVGYTESLFLLTSVAACYHFERDERWRAAAWGLATGLTRPNGCLLSVVLALIALRDVWTIPRTSWARLADRIAVAAMPGLGMVLYSGYIYTLTGHPLQWTVQNAAWGRVYQGLDVLVAQEAQRISHEGLYTFAATRTVDALQLAAVLFVLASVWPVTRRLGLAYGAMILVNVLPPLAMGGLLSMGRVTAVLFPTFVWLAIAVPAAHRPAWFAVWAMVQALCAALFFTWRPMF